MDQITKLYSKNSTLRDEYFTAKNNGGTTQELEKINLKIIENSKEIESLYTSGNIRLQNGTKYYPYK